MIQEIEKINQAKNLFYQKQYSKAGLLFKQANCLCEYGFCKLLEGRLKDAKKIFKSAQKTPFSCWGNFLCGALAGDADVIPTPFQIRNFLEITLTLFLENKFFEWANELVKMGEYFSQINPEVYKYYARCLLNCSYQEVALNFVEASKKQVFMDPEIHFIEGMCKLQLEDKNGAIRAFEENLKVCPKYYPALLMLEKTKRM